MRSLGHRVSSVAAAERHVPTPGSGARAGTRVVGLLLPAVLVASGVAVTTGASPVDALASTTLSSQASAPTVTLGGGEDDVATVQGDPATGSPTGTVSFYACPTGTSQSLTTSSCTNSPLNLLGIVDVTAGASGTSTASFLSFTPRSAGTWCFSAVYNGDTNYSASQDNTSAENLDANECFLVTTIPPTIQTTTTPGTMVLGSGTVTDQAKVMGTTTGGKPTGTVVFYVCQVSTSQTLTPMPCAPSATPEDSGESLVTGADDVSNASAAPFTPTATGTWCFSVDYEGSANYSPAQDNTDNANLDAGECVLVTPAASSSASVVSPTSVTVGPSGTLTDTVTVGGVASGGAPTGTVVFYVCQMSFSLTFAPGSCLTSGTPEDAGEQLTAGAGSSSSATSQPFTPSGAGTWCFSAVYQGSSDYQPSSDNTTPQNVDAHECASVAPMAYTIYTPDHATAVAGQLLSPAVQIMAFPTSPTPRFKKTGRFPPQLRFKGTGSGTATITGKPGKMQAGTYSVTIEAIWGRGKNLHTAFQTFTLTVG
jgi:hypothetical protein